MKLQPSAPLTMSGGGQLTATDVVQALARSRWDGELFANLFGVELHPGQLRAFEAALIRDHTGWRARWLTLALSAGNRAGKTLLMAMLVMHHTIHKVGIRPFSPGATDREVETFFKTPYHWYHFGIQQEVGELVFNEITALLEGRHPAQRGRGCPIVDALGQIAKYDTKERGEYRWVQIDKALGGGEIHFRTTSERALGSLGKEMNGISFDECGFEQNLTFLVNEVLHMRRMGTGGPLWLVSTPSEGFTQFSDEWNRGDPSSPSQEPDHLSLRMSTRDNIGYGIDRGIFDRMIAGYPPALIPQNVDGYFIEGRRAFFNHEAVDASFIKELPEVQDPERGAVYVNGIDPALTYDSTWSIVLKLDKEGRATGVCARRKTGKQTLLNVVGMLKEVHTDYSDGATCVTGLDTSGFGGKVFRDALAGIPNLRNIEFGGTKSRKIKLLTDLKGMLEQGRLRFPRTGIWLDLRRQLLGYRLEDDRKLETDAVMALAVAVKVVLSRPGGSARAQSFDFYAGSSDSTPDDVPEAFRVRSRGLTSLDRHTSLREGVTESTLTGLT